MLLRLESIELSTTAEIWMATSSIEQLYLPFIYLGETTGTEQIVYPSDAKELYVEVAWSNSDFQYVHTSQYKLRSNGLTYIDVGGSSAQYAVYRILQGDKKANLHSHFYNNSDTTATAHTRWYYR